MKNYVEIIQNEWNQAFLEMSQQRGFQRLLNDDLGIEHYKNALRQIYLQTRDNPSLQAAATLNFKGTQRDLMKKYLGHALSEVGHDQLAIEDLKALGEDVTQLCTYRPLPGTSALMGFGYYAATGCAPAVYLGYIYHLESMPMKSGGMYISKLKALGVPESALTFIDEHAKFDVAHMKLNEEYIKTFIQNDEDLENFLFGMRTSAALYSKMLEDAFAYADRGISSLGYNVSEERRAISQVASSSETSDRAAA